MAWSARALQHCGDDRHVDEGLIEHAVRVDFFRCGGKNEIHAAAVQFFTIILKGARVARQVVRTIELHRIDENAYHHHIGPRFRLINQLHMTVMKVSHCRYQRNPFAFKTQTTNLLAQQRYGFNNQHDQDSCSDNNVLVRIAPA